MAGRRRGQGPYHGLRYQPSLLHPAAAGAFGSRRRDRHRARELGVSAGRRGGGRLRRAGLLACRWALSRSHSRRHSGRGRHAAHHRRLHEDGLGDTADGFGASASRERKLDIMRDSEIGAYGTCALILSFMLRTGALVSLAEPRLVALALIAAHAGARATLPVFMRLVPNARRDGLSAGAGTPPQSSAVIGGPARAGHDPALLRLWRRADRRLAARGRDGLMALALHQADRRTDRRRARRARAGQRNPDPARRGRVALAAIPSRSR